MAFEHRIVKLGKNEYVCFEGRFGEPFFFARGALMRGKPCPPYDTAEDYTRPAHMLTLKEVTNMTGLSNAVLRGRIKDHRLPAVKKFVRKGLITRRFWIVDIKDVKEMVARDALLKYTGNKVIWDKEALQLLDEAGNDPTAGK